MPTYEYKCPKCGCFEVIQAITDEALTTCPTCGAGVKRLIPNKVFIAFKGPGFHVNDYPSRGRGPRGREQDDKAPAAEAETAAEKATLSEQPGGKAAAGENISTGGW